MLQFQNSKQVQSIEQTNALCEAAWQMVTTAFMRRFAVMACGAGSVVC